jgi:hypothetical protein
MTAYQYWGVIAWTEKWYNCTNYYNNYNLSATKMILLLLIKADFFLLKLSEKMIWHEIRLKW